MPPTFLASHTSLVVEVQQVELVEAVLPLQVSLSCHCPLVLAGLARALLAAGEALQGPLEILTRSLQHPCSSPAACCAGPGPL